jgi:hypothetical protein
MNYQNVMNEKNLKTEDLPKGLQQKIKELELLNSSLEHFKDLEISEKEQEKINIGKESATEIDNYLVKKLKAFDVEKYQKKKESFDRMMQEKKQKKQSEEQEQKPEVIVDEKVLNEISLQETNNEIKNIQTQKKSSTYNPESSLNKKLDDLKKSVQVDAKNFVEEPKETETEEAEPDEFEKVANSKPRKTNKGLILMGIGAFILTWGAVNFFKDRK